MNYSQQRNCIMKIVTSNAIHPTAEQVYEIARKRYPKISLGTVYRDLNQLSANGSLKKICNSYGSVRYDGRVEPHFHMTCGACGCVFDVELPEMENFEQRIMESDGFEVTEYEISILGVCAQCRVGEETGGAELSNNE